MSKEQVGAFRPLNIAVLTISDTRVDETDTSGKYLAERVLGVGHCLAEKTLVKDNIYDIRAVVSRWIADPSVNAVIATGGTGLTGRDVTVEGITPLFDKVIEGFGEIFRSISFGEIDTSTIQSRAIAGVANATVIFCVPGSTGACKTAWENIISFQLDSTTSPCNLVELMPRYNEK